MNKFEEFMASMARKRENPVNEKSEIGGGWQPLTEKSLILMVFQP